MARKKKLTFEIPILSVMWYTTSNYRQEASFRTSVSTADPIEDDSLLFIMNDRRYLRPSFTIDTTDSDTIITCPPALEKLYGTAYV
jgi:hypothetical protein